MAGVRARCVELLSAVPGVTMQAESEGAAPLVAFTVAGTPAEDVVEALEARGRARALAARPRLGARLARLLGLGRRPRAPRRRAARARVVRPGDFTLEASDGGARAGPADDGARRRSRRRSSCPSARARRSRPSIRASSSSSARRSSSATPTTCTSARAPSSIEELGGLHRFMGWERPDPHRFGRFPGVLAARDAHDRRRRRHVPLRLRRLARRASRPSSRWRCRRRSAPTSRWRSTSARPRARRAADLERAVERTARWAERCVAAPRPAGQLRFGIVQGGTDRELRARSAGAAHRAAVRRATRSAG